MGEAVFTCNFVYSNINYQRGRLNRKIAATADNATFLQNGNSAFFHLYVADQIFVSFFLTDPVGGESYKMEISKHGSPEILYSSNQALCCVQGITDGDYVAKCTVKMPSPKILDPPKDTVMSTFASYCRKNSEYLMTFECGKEKVQAVIGIMKSRSPVIEAMMNSECVEARTKNVEIEDFSDKVIEKMVEFCETNDVKETENYEMELCKIANKYQIDLMIQFAAVLVTKMVNEKNVVEIYQFSKTHNNAELEKYCLKFAHVRRSTILDTADVTKVDPPILKEFWMAINPSNFKES